MTPDEVKALRRRLGLTQLELAIALRITPTTVARWEQGVRAVGPLATLALTHLAQQRGGGRRKAK